MSSKHKYHVQDKMSTIFPHHRSLADLWTHKWKALAESSTYPFMYGKAKDFEDIFESDAAKAFKEPYGFDEYAQFFLPRAESLERQAKAAETAGDVVSASELYLRASSVYRIARFPAPRSDLQWKVWAKNKETFVKGVKLRDTPFIYLEVRIPHKHALSGEGPIIQADYYVPRSIAKGESVPCIIVLGGLDAYRTEMLEIATNLIKEGFAVLRLEVPGTGDSPALRGDSESPERQWSSLLEWCDAQDTIDNKRILAWGLSTGAYYAVRVAHTHRESLVGVVAQGGACHQYLTTNGLLQRITWNIRGS